ncbi:hypothetical protein ANO11243_001440 [Dothideomycetidae sp. 11243]|nr:hypothetical protein ANO11243_001440 [fungal sp. No.11243]
MSTSTPSTTAPLLHPLPPPFSSSSSNLHLISQGAEALLLRTTFLSPSRDIALKYRPPKPYRHPTLDRRLTRARILAEARLLVKCARAGVDVPSVLGVGAEEGWVALSWVEGETVKARLRRIRDGIVAETEGGGQGVRGLLGAVGAAVGKLHAAGVVHGDLTSSNMLLRSGREEKVVLIDFGLAGISSADEDRAVDLYVLERAFGSTHPELEDVFAETVLTAYGRSYGGAKVALRKLEDVRMRGRKKSMLG